MKVKNIVFSGFMAAILGATGAHAAISVASQGYVDSKVKVNADAIAKITKDSGTIDTKVAAAVAPLATSQSVTELSATVDAHGTDIAGLKQADIDLAADIKSNSDAIALLTGGEEGAGALQELTDKINNNAAAIETLNADAATKDSVAYDIAEALKSYSTTAQVEDKVSAVDAKLADYTKTADLDAGFVSETEMTAFKSSNDTAIADAKKAGTDAAVTAAENAADIEQLQTDLTTKITMPEVCATTNCVLSTIGGTVQWVPLTEPLDSTSAN